VRRLLCALLLVALVPATKNTSALLTLGITAAVLVALIAYEALRYAEDRHRLRDSVAR
jgi:hypothetical protein